ncbi:tetratricopeptide repeat protein [Pontivivens ytuae]|uniref:Tetratricopeptide repeat protein n=1 Tax=Pontivivens ytuae TaxID=2789856 RepID=A0A7S9LV43_9RHOB|nr:tetratricopeptide repeat protein [Pontivivens ytuae]QPH55290.1 tetratricopeptide repeat protein [Pontivivens ytuae]
MADLRVVALLTALLVSGCEPPELRPFPEGTPTTSFDVDGVDDPLAFGDLLMERGQFDLALRAYTRAYLDADPDDIGAIELGLGQANARLGRLWRARRHLERAISADPRSTVAWNNLGVVQMSLGEFPAARNALETAFALASGQDDVVRANLARLGELEGDFADTDAITAEDFELVRRGSGRYFLSEAVEEPGAVE